MDIDEVADADHELQVDDSSNDQVFQPFPDPDDPNFDLLFKQVIFHIVRVRQIHSRTHTPTASSIDLRMLFSISMRDYNKNNIQ